MQFPSSQTMTFASAQAPTYLTQAPAMTASSVAYAPMTTTAFQGGASPNMTYAYASPSPMSYAAQTVPVAPQTYQGTYTSVPHYASAPPQYPILKAEVGGWQILEDELGEFYYHVASQQQLDVPPPNAAELYMALQRR